MSRKKAKEERVFVFFSMSFVKDFTSTKTNEKREQTTKCCALKLTIRLSSEKAIKHKGSGF